MLLQHEIKYLKLRQNTQIHIHCLLKDHFISIKIVPISLPHPPPHPPNQIIKIKELYAILLKGSADEKQGETDDDNAKGKRKFE